MLILGMDDTKIMAVVCFLKGEEQRWQMVLWLQRMMGKKLDQKLTFQEVWIQAEKIKSTISEKN